MSSGRAFSLELTLELVNRRFQAAWRIFPRDRILSSQLLQILWPHVKEILGAFAC